MALPTLLTEGSPQIPSIEKGVVENRERIIVLEESGLLIGNGAVEDIMLSESPTAIKTRVANSKIVEDSHTIQIDNIIAGESAQNSAINNNASAIGLNTAKNVAQDILITANADKDIAQDILITANADKDIAQDIVINGKVSASDVLTKTNTTPFTPSLDYHPVPLKTLNDAIFAGIADNSITDLKMAPDVKIGSLALLTTTIKTSVVNAINSLKTLVDTIKTKLDFITVTQAVDLDQMEIDVDDLKNNPIGIKGNSTTVNPTVNNDSSEGYVVGSIWGNSVLNTVYTLVDATIGAGIWILIAELIVLVAQWTKETLMGAVPGSEGWAHLWTSGTHSVNAGILTLITTNAQEEGWRIQSIFDASKIARTEFKIKVISTFNNVTSHLVSVKDGTKANHVEMFTNEIRLSDLAGGWLATIPFDFTNFVTVRLETSNQFGCKIYLNGALLHTEPYTNLPSSSASNDIVFGDFDLTADIFSAHTEWDYIKYQIDLEANPDA